MIQAPNGKRLTQGTIFSCARAGRYDKCDVYGLVITARCDLAHDNKTPVTNYIPVVSFEDWIHRDFFRILQSKCLGNTMNHFTNFLKDNGIAESLLIAHSPREIIEAQLQLTPEDKSIMKKRGAGLNIVDKLDWLCRLETSPITDKPVIKLAKEFDKDKNKLINDCVHQKLSGYYFLPHIEPNPTDQPGFIALLREVHHLPTTLAQNIAVGLDRNDFMTLCEHEFAMEGALDIKEDGFSYPVGQLVSPYIEHLMQMFSILFGRIGLPDPDNDYISKLWSEQPSVKEVKQ